MDRKQPKPLYKIVADSIVEQIDRGDLKPNEQLRSEAELIDHYGVGRNTIRHALGELVEQGVLVTVHGVGTFVSDSNNRISKTAEYLYGFSQEMAARGVLVSSKVNEAKIIEADALLSRQLGIQLGAEVVYLNRTRMMDGEPTAIERAYLPHALCRGILDFDFSKESLYEILSTKYNSRPDHADQEIEAALATNEVATLLILEQPAVVLVFHRETRLSNGQVIEYVDSELRADRFRFNSNLRLISSQNNNMVFQRLPINRVSVK